MVDEVGPASRLRRWPGTARDGDHGGARGEEAEVAAGEAEAVAVAREEQDDDAVRLVALWPIDSEALAVIALAPRASGPTGTKSTSTVKAAANGIWMTAPSAVDAIEARGVSISPIVNEPSVAATNTAPACRVAPGAEIDADEAAREVAEVGAGEAEVVGIAGDGGERARALRDWEEPWVSVTRPAERREVRAVYRRDEGDADDESRRSSRAPRPRRPAKRSTACGASATGHGDAGARGRRVATESVHPVPTETVKVGRGRQGSRGRPLRSGSGTCCRSTACRRRSSRVNAAPADGVIVTRPAVMPLIVRPSTGTNVTSAGQHGGLRGGQRRAPGGRGDRRGRPLNGQR